MTVAFNEGWCTLDVRPSWAQPADENTVALANKQVAEYIARLWFAREVTYDSKGIYVELHGKGRRLLVSLSEKELERLRRTIRNRMYGFLFWANKHGRKLQTVKVAHHPRTFLGTGAVATAQAVRNPIVDRMKEALDAGNDVINRGGLIIASGGRPPAWAYDNVGVAYQQMGMPLI